MAIIQGSVNVHWNYFLSLEEELVQIARFIEPTKHNYSTYSIEITRLYLSTCSEVDVVAKLVCEDVSSGSKPRNINDYRGIIMNAYPDLPDFEVTIPKYGLSTRPWERWSGSSNPKWWTDHNKVKHERNDHYHRANLKNCTNALAGLFTLIIHLYSEEAKGGELVPPPKLVNVGDSHFGGGVLGRLGMAYQYNL